MTTPDFGAVLLRRQRPPAPRECLTRDCPAVHLRLGTQQVLGPLHPRTEPGPLAAKLPLIFSQERASFAKLRTWSLEGG